MLIQVGFPKVYCWQ